MVNGAPFTYMSLDERGEGQNLHKGSRLALLEWARMIFLLLLLEIFGLQGPQTICDGTMTLILAEQLHVSLQPIKTRWKSWKLFVPGLKKTQVLYFVPDIILGQAN